MRSALTLSLLSLSLAGCFMGVRGEHYAYRERVAVDEGRLRLDGYYAHEWTRGDGRMLQPIVLWSDGTAAVFSGLSHGRGEEPIAVEPSFADLHDRFQAQLREVTGERTPWKPSWGAFRIRGDSISIQVMQYYSYGGGSEYRALGYQGVILNDSTFTITTLLAPHRDHREPLDWTYRFQPLAEKPSSTNWTQTDRRLQ